MSFKMLSFLLSLIALTFFIGFNLDNRCDVSLIFYTFKDVPVCVSLLFAFVSGAVVFLSAGFFSGSRDKRQTKAEKNVRDRYTAE